MPFRQVGNLRIYEFESFSSKGLTHGIVTRTGGLSPSPWNSLNVGGGIGDNEQFVAENISRIFDALGRDLSSKYDVWQIHSVRYHVAELPYELHKADILVTDNPELTLFMRYADCVPIMLYDPQVHAIALAHAGWRGIVENVPAVAVEALVSTYGSNPKNLIAALGPAICKECYEVGPEVVEQVSHVLGGDTTNFIVCRNEKFHLDMWSVCETLLQRIGVSNIEIASICTAMNLDDWFSHRAENGKTGRFAALLGLAG